MYRVWHSKRPSSSLIMISLIFHAPRHPSEIHVQQQFPIFRHNFKKACFMFRAAKWKSYFHTEGKSRRSSQKEKNELFTSFPTPGEPFRLGRRLIYIVINFSTASAHRLGDEMNTAIFRGLFFNFVAWESRKVVKSASVFFLAQFKNVINAVLMPL